LADQRTSQDGGPTPEKPAHERSSRVGRAVLILTVLVGVGITMRFLAYGFPAHVKTLERDAVLSGFAGGILVVQELIRELLRDLVAIANILSGSVLAGVLAGVAGIAVETAGVSERTLGVIGLLILLGVGVVLGASVTIVEESRAKATFAALWAKVAASLSTYCPLVLGFLLLLLSMFLQLRAIDLGRS